jgi:alginate O-acetyltransferase complex protein AlgI
VFVLYWFIAQRWLRGQNFHVAGRHLLLLWLLESEVSFPARLFHPLGLLHGCPDPRCGITAMDAHLAHHQCCGGAKVLGFFNHYNLFVEGPAELTRFFGLNTHSLILSVALPVGISFNTILGLSYVFDIYYERIKPHNNAIGYALFASSFPLLAKALSNEPSTCFRSVKSCVVFNKVQVIDGLHCFNEATALLPWRCF